MGLFFLMTDGGNTSFSLHLVYRLINRSDKQRHEYTFYALDTNLVPMEENLLFQLRAQRAGGMDQSQ